MPSFQRLLVLYLITPSSLCVPFLPPLSHLLFCLFPAPHPLSGIPLLFSSPLCLVSVFLPELSISRMFSWGSNRTLTVQDCRQLVWVPVDLHGCTSQADFVLNLSPKCTQKTIVRLKGVKSITGRQRQRQTFRVSARFTKPHLKSFLMLPGTKFKINLTTKI